jgi:hypothetical protein
MKSIYTFSLLLLTVAAMAKPIDTIQIKSGGLNMKALQTGSYSYIIYTKQTKESPAQRLVLVKINVKAQQYHNKPAFIVTQEWDRDTIVHAAYSVFDAKDFSTILHDTWWKSLGYSMRFDFEAKTVGFMKNGIKGEIPDSIKTTAIKDFNGSFENYNLNWHADLLIYQLLPYKEDRTFVINYYDPGFGPAVKVMYTVTGSDILINSRGEKVDCWVLYNYDPRGTERFWIAKQTKEVLKEEDTSPQGYRYKIKFEISGDK